MLSRGMRLKCRELRRHLKMQVEFLLRIDYEDVSMKC